MLWRNIAIGSSTYGNVTDVLVEGGRIGADVDALPTPWAIKIKTHTPLGGVVRNVTFRGTQLGTIDGTAIDVLLEPYNNPAFPPRSPTPAASSFSGISLLDVHVLRARAAGNLRAVRPFFIHQLALSNVSFASVPNSSATWSCARLAGTVAEGVTPPLPAACF